MKRRRFLTVTVGVLVLSGGLVLANYGGGVTPAVAKDLSGVTPNWDQNLPSASRFTKVFTGAVRDNNTGLVWEQAPDATPVIWSGATDHCVSRNVGGTVGWRLPSVVELKSVQDPTLPAPFVPASAFTIGATPGVQSDNYWSATTFADGPTLAWSVVFIGGGDVFFNVKTNTHPAWCVRGGMNADAY
jgi:hypothetical protein